MLFFGWNVSIICDCVFSASGGWRKILPKRLPGRKNPAFRTPSAKASYFMMGIDRYSLQRKKETLGRVLGGLGILFGGLYEYCNSSPKRRIISVICLVLVLAGVMKLFSSVSSLGGMGGTVESLGAKDRQGNNWVLEPIKGQPMSKFAKSSSKPGEPLTVAADVEIEGREVSIGLVVAGQAGEKYVGGAIKNNVRQPAPTFEIIDENKKVLESGAFEYG